MSTGYSWKGKGRYGSFGLQMNDGWVGKSVKSLENTCHTWALLRWWFTTKRRYIKCMHLYLYFYPCAARDFIATACDFPRWRRSVQAAFWTARRSKWCLQNRSTGTRTSTSSQLKPPLRYITRSDRRTDRSVRLVCPTGRSDDRIV